MITFIIVTAIILIFVGLVFWKYDEIQGSIDESYKPIKPVKPSRVTPLILPILGAISLFGYAGLMWHLSNIGVLDFSLSVILWFAAFLCIGGLASIAMNQHDKLESQSADKKICTRYEIAGTALITMAGIIVVIPIIALIGFIWYFFCSGFLIFEDTSFWEKVFYGILSLLFLVFLIGSVALFFKK